MILFSNDAGRSWLNSLLSCGHRAVYLFLFSFALLKGKKLFTVCFHQVSSSEWLFKVYHHCYILLLSCDCYTFLFIYFPATATFIFLLDLVLFSDGRTCIFAKWEH